jgi:hypothetical protein
MRKQLENAVDKAFEHDKDDVPANFRSLFSAGADDIKKQRVETIQHWLETVRLAADTGRRESQAVESQLRRSMKEWLKSGGRRPTVRIRQPSSSLSLCISLFSRLGAQ